MKYLLVIILFLANFAHAHAARLDNKGGHNCSEKSKVKGLCSEYHFHNIPRSADVEVTEYDRDTWPHWVDEDKDCQDARAEALIRDSLVEVKFKRNKGCNVSWGQWRVPYTNEIVLKASSTDADHIVPLGHAHFHGAMNWSREQKRAFANDLENILIVSASANRSKGDRSPNEWMPPYQPYHCTYLKKWVYIKLKYSLTYGSAEQSFLRSKSKECQLELYI